MANDRKAFSQFIDALTGRDPKTLIAYRSVLDNVADWLATKPGGSPFRMELLTETALDAYMQDLAKARRAPRTRSKTLTILRRFCRWAIDEGLLRRDSTRYLER